jgi:uncharacterized alpha-E superfamily protein
MARYLERAENTARLLDVNLHLMLDYEGLEVQDSPEHWLPLIESHGEAELFAKLYHRADSHSVVEYLAFNPENPNSIFSCIATARENARSVRDEIPAEMWEVINAMYHKLRGSDSSSIWSQGPYEFFESLKADSLLFQGLAESTYVHDHGYKFMQAGRYLERADQTSRILDTKHFMAASANNSEPGGSIDLAEWMAVLRSCSAFEAYHRRYVDEIQPANVAEFLVLSSVFPRSMRFCVGALDYHLRSISSTQAGQFTNRAEQLCGRLRYAINYTTIDEILRTGLHEFIDQFQLQLIDIHRAILDSYVYLPAAHTMPPRQQQQQQQQ